MIKLKDHGTIDVTEIMQYENRSQFTKISVIIERNICMNVKQTDIFWKDA